MTPDQLATPGGKSLGDEQLLAIVEAATPGPYVQSEGTPSRVDTPSGAITIAWSDSRDANPFDRAERQAAFIATFAPPTVKALILRAQTAEAALAEARNTPVEAAAITAENYVREWVRRGRVSSNPISSWEKPYQEAGKIHEAWTNGYILIGSDVACTVTLTALGEAIAADDIKAIMAFSPTPPAVERLVAALKASEQGWSNALELGLIPEQHRETAEKLKDQAWEALASFQEVGR
jgi:hypothetical protein